MNSEGGESFQLPQPEAPAQSGEQVEEQAVERQRSAVQEAGVGKSAPQPGSTATTDATDVPAVQDVPTVAPADQKAPIGSGSPLTADLQAQDADLIEKQWIERAKTIVAKTRDDPHLQKSEMSKVKADYIQKRFNKTIKTDEAAA